MGMHLKHDERADAIYIELDPAPYAYGIDLDHRRRVDFAEDGHPIGVELLSVSKGVRLADLPQPDELAGILESAGIKVLVTR